MDYASSQGGTHGNERPVIRITDLEGAERIAHQILSDSQLAVRVKALQIEIPQPDEDNEDNDNQDTDERNQKSENVDPDLYSGSSESALVSASYKICLAVTQVLSAIGSSGGSLEEFAWNEHWWRGPGFRPPSFWEALWKHARTLKQLTLDFEVHEVHEVAPTQVLFPALKELKINAAGAHGDDGKVIEHLLKSSPNLEVLDFRWPSCDLLGCQIKNITWDYSFPSLHTLTITGWTIDAQALQIFLARHSSIKTLTDHSDAYMEDDGANEGATAIGPLPSDTLPGLTFLDQATHFPCRTLKDWFNPQTGRPIKHLVTQASNLSKLEVLIGAKHRLRTLAFRGSFDDWRPAEAESEDEDGEEGGPSGTDGGKNLLDVKGEGDEGRPKYEKRDSNKELRDILPRLPGLRELAIELETGNTWISLGNGKWGDPDPMDENDLRLILTMLPEHPPQQYELRVLRLIDSRGAALPSSLLDDFPSVPPSLEFVSWEAQREVLYRLERMENGRIGLVECARPTRSDGAEWQHKHVLNHEE